MSSTPPTAATMLDAQNAKASYQSQHATAKLIRNVPFNFPFGALAHQNPPVVVFVGEEKGSRPALSQPSDVRRMLGLRDRR
jgi:hypothetical protein